MSGYGRLLHNRAFMVHICFKGSALGLLFAYISSSPFILQTHYGLSQTAYGFVIGFNALFVAAGSMIALKFNPLKRAARTGALILVAGVTGEAFALYLIHSIWIYELFMIIILFALGMIFSTANTLAMNEGRQQAGEASSLLGTAGYVVGAIVSPLVGMGDIMHSTAIVYVAVLIAIMICSQVSKALAPDLGN